MSYTNGNYTVGTAEDFIVYPEQFFSGLVETLQTDFAKFNGNAAGCINLITEGHIGDFTKKSFVKHTPGLIQERDNLSNAAVQAKVITHGEYQEVKLNRRIGPVDYTLDEFIKLGENPELASYQIGQMMGPQVAEDYLKIAISAVGAAIESEGTKLTVDKYNNTLTTSFFVDAMRLLGDQGSKITAWVMHSKPFWDLVGDQLANQVLATVAGAIVYGGSPATFGKPVIVSDVSALEAKDWDGAGSETAAYPVLGLISGAVTVKESEGRRIANKLLTGRENLYQELQGEYAFNLGVKGCSYKGTRNPNLATVSDKANWATFLTTTDYLKGMPGVRILVK